MSNLLSIVLCNSLKAFVLLSLFALAIFSIPSKLHPPPFRNVVDRVLLYFRETRFFIINVILPVSIQAFNTLKATLSTALPNREESAFEEEFKYLIVTSSLLSDMPSLSQKYASTAPTHPSPKQQSNPPIFLIPAVTVTSLFCITSFLKSLAPLTRSIVVTASTSVALYAFHHQKRRARIRQIYSTALHLLRQLVTQCGQNDAQFARLLDRLHGLDLISQGHTLAPAASAYISLSDPSRQSVEIRRLLAHELRTQNQKYTTFIDRMDALSHQENLLRFRNMYNVEKMPTHTSDFESLKVSIEKLENMATMIHWKRRECVIHLLALDVMTADHDSTRHDYEQQWDSAIRIMREMVNECQRYNELLNRQLEHELVPESDDDDAEHPDRRTQAHLVHRYTALEKQMQQIRGKMLLCRQDTASITSSRNTTGSNYAFDRISERFSSIEQDLSHLMMQWEETKNTFDSLKQEHYHETALPPSSSNNSMLPSPPSSPKKVKEHMRMATPGSHRAVVRKAATIAYFLENRRTQKQRNHEQLLESLNQKRSSMSFSSALN